MYPSYSVAYITEDFVNWKHVDIGIPHLRYSPCRRMLSRQMVSKPVPGMSEVYVADDPLGPFTLCGHLTDMNGNRMAMADGCYLADGDHVYFYWHGSRMAEAGEPDVEVITGTLGAELDPDKPWQLITEPVWINTFDPSQGKSNGAKLCCDPKCRLLM